MPFVSIDNENIYYSRPPSSASGPNLLAIHGSGGTHLHWPEALRMLENCRVYAVDLPGHGRSQGSGYDRIEDYADFTQGLIDRLHLHPVILVGHSLGGAVVQMLAMRNPFWLDAVILVGTGARLRVHPLILERLLSDFQGAIDLICDWAFGPTASRELVESARQEFITIPPAVIHGDYRACNRFDIMDKVATIRLPTLIVAGSADRLTPVKYAAYLQNRIPRARLSIIDDAGHMMALENPVEFVACVKAFLVAEMQ